LPGAILAPGREIIAASRFNLEIQGMEYV
jgi:hypothetical protein